MRESHATPPLTSNQRAGASSRTLFPPVNTKQKRREMMHRLHGVMCNEDELCWREHLEHLEHLECSGVSNLTSRAMSFLHQSVLLTQPAASISQSSSCTTGNCRKDLIARGCAFGFLHVCLFLCSAFSSFANSLRGSFVVKFFLFLSSCRNIGNSSMFFLLRVAL